MAIGGLYGLLGSSIAKRARILYERWRMLRARDRIGLLFGLLFLQGLFEGAVGTPMLAWDSIVSWDKWAIDMAMRHGLGQYLMGGYPQLLPTLHSVFYKVAGTGGDVLPVEHLLLHGFCVTYAAILMLSLWCLARNLRIPCILVWLLFVWNKDVFEYLVNGYVDIPLTATVSAVCALLFAYRAGDWKTSPGILPDSTIFFLSLFPVAFTKGTGMVWSLLLAAFLLIVSWKRHRCTMACISIAFVMLSVAPYFLHQFYYSRHADLAEQSPFLHVFTLQVAHTSIFTPDLKHANALIAQLMNAYSAPENIGIAVTLLGAGICLLALFRLRLTFFAISGALTLVMWFFAASYDFRNAFTAFYVLIIAFIGALFDPDLGKQGNKLRYFCCFAFVFAGLYFAPENQVYKTFIRPLRSYHSPRCWVRQPGHRHMAVRPWGDIRVLLFNTPWGQRATHLWAGTGLYRLLAPRGVYAMNFNSFREAQRHDLAVGETFTGKPKGFVPVAELQRTGGGQTLSVYEPEFHPVAVDIQSTEPSRESATMPNALLRANQTYLLCVSDIGNAMKDPSRDGVLAIRLDQDGGDADLLLHPDDAQRDPYAPYFRSIREGTCIRLIYWMREDGPAYPRFLLKVGTHDIRLSSAELGQ